MKILAGSHNGYLAQKVSQKTGFSVIPISISRFPNGEYKIQIKESLSGQKCIIINSMSHPTHDNIMQMFLLADAAKRSGAKKITAIVPWLAYSPQDKVFRQGEPLSSKVLVSLLESLPINNFILLDVHSSLILDYFQKPVKEISALPLFQEYINQNLTINSVDWYVVALDKGSIKRSSRLAKLLKLEIKNFNKKRDQETGEITYTRFPEELQNKNVIIVDDYTSTGGTLVQAVEHLKGNGARECVCFLTYCVSREGLDAVLKSRINQLIITNSITYPDLKHDKLTILDISSLIAQEIL